MFHVNRNSKMRETFFLFFSFLTLKGEEKNKNPYGNFLQCLIKLCKW